MAYNKVRRVCTCKAGPFPTDLAGCILELLGGKIGRGQITKHAPRSLARSIDGDAARVEGGGGGGSKTEAVAGG